MAVMEQRPSKSKLESIRKRVGYSRAQAAAHLAMSERSLYRMEREPGYPVKLVYVRQLAEFYGVELPELLEDDKLLEDM